MNISDFEYSLNKIANEKIGYYKNWLFDDPFYVSKEKYLQSIDLQKGIKKIINEVVLNYDLYFDLMPISERSKKLYDIWKDKPYQTGSYRTDFVIDENFNYRPIEITCRFALNGFFLTNILNPRNAFEGMKSLGWQPYDDFKFFFFSLLENKKEVVILKDSEFKNESKIFEPVFDEAKIPYKSLNLDALKDFGGGTDVLVINELTISELEKIPLNVHKKLKRSHFINDIRTILLVHDKRFFSLLFNKEIQHKVLDENEISLFNKTLVPTYNYSTKSDEWSRARKEKDKWIIKHSKLGKSEMIYAGIVTSDEEWAALFDRSDLENFVLQKWIDQPKFIGRIRGEFFNDYFTGSYLFFNDSHFGFSEFRTSSHPVTNVVDHRKSIGVIEF